MQWVNISLQVAWVIYFIKIANDIFKLRSEVASLKWRLDYYEGTCEDWCYEEGCKPGQIGPTKKDENL
jgi:hypothetical protein